jgi:hypothetical protein
MRRAVALRNSFRTELGAKLLICTYLCSTRYITSSTAKPPLSPASFDEGVIPLIERVIIDTESVPGSDQPVEETAPNSQSSTELDPVPLPVTTTPAWTPLSSHIPLASAIPALLLATANQNR